MEEALAPAERKPAPPEVPLKRQWDDDLEAELEAALSGFDPKTFDVAKQRPPKQAAGTAPRSTSGDRGQEARKGPRMGKVIVVRGKSIFVDLGGKSEGVIPVDQFEGEIPAPGRRSRSSSTTSTPARGSCTSGSRGRRSRRTGRTSARGVIVEARVTKVNKGGVEVDVDGIRGFMPIGQIDLNRVEDAAVYVNQKFKALVTEANAREKNLVVSRRELLEQERAEMREKTWAALEEGQVREGTSARSRTSAPSSTSAASTASCRSAR